MKKKNVQNAIAGSRERGNWTDPIENILHDVITSLIITTYMLA